MAKIEIMHVSTGQQLLQMQVEYVNGMTVQQALDTSGFLVKYPELNGLSVGVYSKQVSLDTKLRPDDRLEIYRPLKISPMEKRRLRAKNSK